MTPSEFAAAVDRVVAATNFGTPSAARRGRNPAYPYVPVIDYGQPFGGVGTFRTRQVIGRAYKTHSAALDAARMTIEHRRAVMRHHLFDVGHRGLRRQYGLPEEAPAEIVA